MKHLWKYMGLGLLVCGTACTREVPLPASPAGEGNIVVSVAPPELKGTTSRASFPLGPELENPIKNLTLLVFDRENQHRIGHADYYAYRDYVGPAAPDGVLLVDNLQYNGGLNREQDATLCVVANVDKDRLLEAIRQEGTGDVISLAAFRRVTVDLSYHTHPDSVGLVKSICMFGYYRGKLVPESSKSDIEISLGRIISRLNISLSVSEELAKVPGMKYAVRLKNALHKAYIFPGDTSPAETVTEREFTPVALDTEPLTRYHYVGPHAAGSEAEATQIEIAYGTDLGDTPFPATGSENTVSVALCNEPPEMGAQRDYWLNRNCIYNISIRLKKRGEPARTTRSSTVGLRVVEIDIP